MNHSSNDNQCGMITVDTLLSHKFVGGNFPANPNQEASSVNRTRRVEALSTSRHKPQASSVDSLLPNPRAASESAGGKASLEEYLLANAHEAALGLHRLLGLSENEHAAAMAGGCDSIVGEVMERGTEEDKENLNYVFRCSTGSSSRTFQHGWARDEARPHGLMLRDFAECDSAKAAGLCEAAVLALRLYTTSTFR